MKTFLIVLITAAIVIAFIATTIYMCFMAARSNGWSELAKRYRREGRRPRGRLRFQSISLNDYALPATMQFAALEEGLWLMPSLLFHPPLLIPWAELTSRRRQNRFRTWLTLELPEPHRFKLEIQESTRSKLLAQAQPAWRGARRALEPAPAGSSAN